MGRLSDEIFVCVDCETTGLDLTKDRIIEVGAVRFTLEEELDRFESLIDPECSIPSSSIEIHHITDAMVKGKPKIATLLPAIFEFLEGAILVGHGIDFDCKMLCQAARRASLACPLASRPSMDTLRLARLYGESPNNALETLRHHFNITPEAAHRALDDAVVNMQVFRYLVRSFKTTEQVFEKLSYPIRLKKVPLGKYKGWLFQDVPIDYLKWAAKMDFDQDLLFSIRSELKRRDTGPQFGQASNPFKNLP